MHNSHFINFITAYVVTSAAFLAHGKDINNDTTYSYNPDIKLIVTNNATLTLAFQNSTSLENNLEVNKGATIHFKNASTNEGITYSFDDGEVCFFGNTIVGDSGDEYSTTVKFPGANASFQMQDLTIYGGSKLITGTNKTQISGHLRSLKNAASLSPQEAHISFNLDTSNLQSLTIESTINLSNLTLFLTTAPLALNIAPEYISDDGSYTLFTNVNSLFIDKTGNTATTYDASAFFTSAHITDDSQLVYTSDGSIILTGLVDVIPEPSTASLSLLTLLGFAMRRRRG